MIRYHAIEVYERQLTSFTTLRFEYTSHCALNDSCANLNVVDRHFRLESSRMRSVRVTRKIVRLSVEFRDVALRECLAKCRAN